MGPDGPCLPAALLPVARGGLRIIAPSLPGFGASTPLRLRSPLGAFARRIVALLEVLDPEKPVFATGHSFGGGIALKLAQLRPDFVRSVTVVNPVGGAPDSRGLRRAGWLGWSLAGALSHVPRSRPQAFDPRAAADVVLDFLPNLGRRPLRLAVSGAVALTAQLADEARQLVDSGVPMLYVWGDRDRLVLPGRLHGLGGPEGTEVVAGGHGWVITHPEEFAATLQETLAVHALLELETRGSAPAVAAAAVSEVVLDPSRRLADAFPPERRRRARHTPPQRPTLVSGPPRPMGWR